MSFNLRTMARLVLINYDVLFQVLMILKYYRTDIGSAPKNVAVYEKEHMRIVIKPKRTTDILFNMSTTWKPHGKWRGTIMERVL